MWTAKREEGVKKVQSLVYVENGWPLAEKFENTFFSTIQNKYFCWQFDSFHLCFETMFAVNVTKFNVWNIVGFISEWKPNTWKYHDLIYWNLEQIA